MLPSPVARRLIGWLIVALSLAIAAPATAAKTSDPRIHKVLRGHSLGSIANRYGVRVSALCHANKIPRSKPLQPGQRLYIPPKSDRDGAATRKFRTEHLRSKKKRRASDTSPRGAGGSKFRWHKVHRGQRLGSIAKRYRIPLAALCHANEIPRCRVIKPGQKLIVPERDDVDGSSARLARRKHLELPADEPAAEDASDPVAERQSGPNTWAKYVRKPKRPGHVDVIGRKERRFTGRLVTGRGLIVTAAKKRIADVLGTSSGDTIAIDKRLLRLLAKVSDTFGGRTIRVVSGYRLGATTSSTSRHRLGRAIDFTIEGVPNTVLRDYLKTLDDVGVGYYPNSHFVHLDVRTKWTYWVDHSGPGEAPRYGGYWTKAGRVK